MNEVVDRVLKRYALMQTMDEARVAESREKLADTSRSWPPPDKKIPIN
jgi:hypothetical protein